MDDLGNSYLPATTKQTDPLKVTDEPYELFDLDVKDYDLYQLCIKDMQKDVDHWNNGPWKLKETDDDNVQYFLGQQLNDKLLLPHSVKYVDNRLFVSTRAILSYVFGQLAKPDVTPSKGDPESVRTAKALELAVYHHALNNNVAGKFKTAGKNLIIRKRGCIKLRFDPDKGPYGDIITENIDPADIIIDRYAKLGDNPNRIYHRQKCTLEELVGKFPNKKEELLNYYGIKRGTFSQMSRIVTYYECWFTFYKDGKAQEGLCWFIPNSQVILGKMRNPNWIDTGSEKKQKIVNLTDYPIKPFVWFNYMNTGRSYIDETSLFDQAKPQQDLLNKRGRQIWENADYANPRVLVNGSLMDESDATKFVNKHPKTIGIMNKMKPEGNINNAVSVIPATMLPDYVVSTLYDSRNEVDTMMGTPSQFRGEQPQNVSKTLGQDLLVRQQAGALQDDLVRAVNDIYAVYYMYLIQMMKVYLTDDYWILTKGISGQYVPVMLNSDSIDTNVKVGVQVDSTLPLDNQSQHQLALQLAQLQLIDPLSLYRDLGLPDAEERAERLNKFMLDKAGYANSVTQQLYDAEADADIKLLIAKKRVEERKDYNEKYLNHFNLYIASNGFRMLPIDAQQRIQEHLSLVADKAALTAHLQTSMLNPAGMIDMMQPADAAMMQAGMQVDQTQQDQAQPQGQPQGVPQAAPIM